jgi:hypothetical protein
VSAYTGPCRRRSRGQWIARFLADHVDIRTPLDLLAFFCCSGLVVFCGWIVLHPHQFRDRVLSFLARIGEALSWLP